MFSLNACLRRLRRFRTRCGFLAFYLVPDTRTQCRLCLYRTQVYPSIGSPSVALFLNLPSMCGILVVMVVNTLYLDSHRTPMSHLNSA